jgi:hypothetical protein
MLRATPDNVITILVSNKLLIERPEICWRTFRISSELHLKTDSGQLSTVKAPDGLCFLIHLISRQDSRSWYSLQIELAVGD